jgi:hypothetical protein
MEHGAWGMGHGAWGMEHGAFVADDGVVGHKKVIGVFPGEISGQY